MKKILYLLNYAGQGGSEKYVSDLMNAVGKQNCILVYSIKGELVDKLIESGFQTFEVPMKHPLDLNAAKKIKQIIAQQQIDVVHAQFLRENFIGILAKMMGAKVDVVWTYHVDVPMSGPTSLLNRSMTRFNKNIIAVSRFMKEQLLKKGISEQKLKVIYNGIESPDNTKQNPGIRRNISVIGRLREEKGQDFLINSLIKLRDMNPDLQWTCSIYGDGPAREQYENLVESNGINDRITFMGHQTNKEQIYSNTDIIVVPSKNEALSYVAIEGLAYSKYVIATDIGGLPEVIVDNETGNLVKYGDVEGLANLIAQALSNDEQIDQIVQQGQEFFDKNYRLETMIARTVDIYEK